MYRKRFYIINSITVYRMVASIALLFMILLDRLPVFRWLLAISFFTDAIDGYLARKNKVTSIFGARMDSIADDLTILMAIIGVFVWKEDFIREELFLIILMTGLYLLQLFVALFRYGRISSFHTYLAKCAAVCQGIFLVLLFFLPQWPHVLFYIASAFTILDLVEEIILVLLIPQWKTDIKGIYWVAKKS